MTSKEQLDKLVEIANTPIDDNAAYIPVVDEFICDVDVANKEIVVDLPRGLLDL